VYDEIVQRRVLVGIYAITLYMIRF